MLNLINALSAIFIFLLSVLSGWPALSKPQAKHEHGHQTWPMGEALAVGIFLGIGLMHLLPEAHDKLVALGVDYPWASLIAGVVFLFLLWVEHIGREWVEHHGLYNRVFAGMAVLMFSFHSLLAGMVLGLEANWTLQLPIFIAIVAHKWAESFALATHIHRSSMVLRMRQVLFLLFCLMTPMGIVLGVTVSQTMGAEGILVAVMLALSAGMFLYLGTLHGLFKAVLVERCCNLRHYGYVMLGFAIMAAVAAVA